MARMRRAVIIALHNLTYSSRVFKQADALVAAGFEVTIAGIVQRATDPLTELQGSVRLIRVRTTKHLYAEAPSGATPQPPARLSRPGFLAGIRTFLGRMRDNRLLADAALVGTPDVVIASDLLTLAAGHRVKRRSGAPLVLDVRDLVLDSGTNLAGSYAWLLGLLERSLIGTADAITAVGPALGEVIRQRFPTAAPVTAIYSGAFESVARAMPLHSPLRLFFQGRLVANRRIDELLEAMTLLADVDVVLTIQGFGEEESRLRQMVSDLGLTGRVRFVEPCESREVVKHAAEHDIGVICYRGDTLNLWVSTPIKLLDYMAAGLAVLASDLPGIRGIVEPEECGVLFEQTGPESIARAVRHLADDPDLIVRMKKRSVNAAPQYLASAQGERFVEVVQSVLTPPARTGGGAT